ncbi:MAG: tRNA-dihydrouridine synthase [Halomonadaceae bacterium]|nr:MAG: tRNA-dihydrouridine synthase [Halomonadaceae bacterium]
MEIHLAPMEGLVDPTLRRILTSIGGVDQCVTEFIRVSDVPLPRRVFHRTAPELAQGAVTAAGTPVHVQLLGSRGDMLAVNAARAAALGAPVVDLNFGCPAKTVNRHRGGAILLQEPEVLYQLVSAVRGALPGDIPVTAKMRLGYTDKSLAVECAQALEAGGAASITVHARTKTDGYKPPAYWPWIDRIREAVKVRIVANGEVWTLADYHQCRTESGCEDVMLGRGLIARPDLALQVRQALAGETVTPMTWQDFHPWLVDFYDEVVADFDGRHAPGRLKQWLNYLRLSYPEAETLFRLVRREKDIATIHRQLSEAAHLTATVPAPKTATAIV